MNPHQSGSELTLCACPLAELSNSLHGAWFFELQTPGSRMAFILAYLIRSSEGLHGAAFHPFHTDVLVPRSRAGRVRTLVRRQRHQPTLGVSRCRVGTRAVVGFDRGTGRLPVARDVNFLPPLVIISVLLVNTKLGQRLSTLTPLPVLVGFQAFRLPLEWDPSYLASEWRFARNPDLVWAKLRFRCGNPCVDVRPICKKSSTAGSASFCF